MASTFTIRRVTLSTLLCVVGLMWSGTARAAWRATATRPLRIEWAQDGAAGALLRSGLAVPSATEGVVAPAPSGHMPAPSGVSNWVLYLTREADGTRNLWRALPQTGSATPRHAESDDGDVVTPVANPVRNLTWRAAPLTHLAAPLFAAHPAVSSDGKVLLCVTNAPLPASDGRATGLVPNSPVHSRIARLDVPSNRWTALTAADAHDSAPVIAPGDRQFAIVSDRAGLESVYVMPLGGGPARRVATMGRNPCWLDENTIVFESTRPGRAGLFRLRVDITDALGATEVRPTAFFDRLGEAAVAPDGRLVCAAARPVPGLPRRLVDAADSTAASGPVPAASQLYLIAPDGSSARAITGTDGAASPHFTPDGSAVVFDAPAEANGDAPRMLWLLPLLHVPPTAVLMKVAPLNKVGPSNVAAPPQVEELEVLGTAFAEGTGVPSVQLEYGAGTEPTTWQKLSLLQIPVQQGRLATWRIPAQAQGDYTLRLTVTDATGERAVATYTVTLPFQEHSPLEGNAPIFPTHAPSDNPLAPTQANSVLLKTPPADGAPTTVPPDTITPDATATEPPTTVVAAPATTGTGGNPVPDLPLPAPIRTQTPSAPGTPPRFAGPVPSLPLPALPPAPTPHPAPPPTTSQTFNPPLLPPDSDAAPPLHIPSPATRPGRSTRVRRPRARTPVKQPRVANTTARASNSSTPVSAPITTDAGIASGADAARIMVSGTPATMQLGQTVPVNVTVQNTGTRAWGADSDQPVRLVYRWVDATTGTRTRWAITWLHSDVRPGHSLQVPVNLAAPPRPGRYRLSYILIRLNGAKLEPPAATTPQQRWPGEFGTVTYSVVVR